MSSKLLINGNLRTVKHWRKKVFEEQQKNFSKKEKQQLEALYNHYKQMQEKDNNCNNNAKQIRKTLEVAEEIGVEL